MADSEPKIVMCDLGKVMRKYLSMSPQAVDCVFGHGQVKLDGRVLQNDERRLVYDEIRGGLLEVPGRCLVLGTRPIVNEGRLF